MINDEKINKVCVMLASYNGEKYIGEQIDSILQQKDVDIKLVVRDDGSTDGTIEILEEYKNKYGIRIIYGNNMGPAANFYELLNNAYESDYYAWSDQDDIWDSDKLITAIYKIKNTEKAVTIPILYYSASRAVDKEKKIISNIGVENPSINYGAALVRSKAQGSTFVFNNNLINIAKKYVPDFKKCHILHDAWLHKVCLALGGTVIHDPVPHMSYRIHDNNVVARIPSHSFKDRILGFLSSNTENYCSKVAKELINGYKKDMTLENYYLTNNLAYYRENIMCKTKILFSKYYRIGTFKEDIKFKLSILLNKA